MKRIPIIVALLLAVGVTACASEDAGSSAAPSEAATPEPTATPVATDDVPGASIGPLPSFDFDGDPELAGRFPDTVDGQPLVMQSLDGETFAAAGDDPVFDEFLEAIGAEATDVSVAFGGATFGEEVLSAGAFRVRGADEDELEREFIATSQASGEAAELTETTIGGKEVWTAVDPSGETDLQVFIYTNGDTLYFLTGSVKHATEILEALP